MRDGEVGGGRAPKALLAGSRHSFNVKTGAYADSLVQKTWIRITLPRAASLHKREHWQHTTVKKTLKNPVHEDPHFRTCTDGAREMGARARDRLFRIAP